METKEELAKDLAEKLSQLKQMEETQSLLKTNVNEFTFKEKLYRVHRPNASESEEVNKERMKKYISFLQDPSYLFRKQLVQLLEQKGVNITLMESENVRMYKEEQELLKRLAQTTIKQDVENLEQEINDLRDLQRENFMEREELLKYCIEKQLEDFVKFYLLYLMLEVKSGEGWERVFKSYEDFQKSEEDLLLGRATQVLSTLVYNDNL